jgi:hypothetical protein
MITSFQNLDDEASGVGDPVTNSVKVGHAIVMIDQAQEKPPVSAGFQVGEVFIPITSPPAEGGTVSPKGTSRPHPEETSATDRVDPVWSRAPKDGRVMACCRSPTIIWISHVCPTFASILC